MKTYSELHPDQAAILAEGEAALGRVEKQNFLDWIRVGHSITILREIAMTRSGTDDIDSYAYRQAIGTAKQEYPKLAALNKTEASHACWLWDNHEALEVWHRALAPNQARSYNHPSTIWHKNPLGEYRQRKPRASRAEAADVLKDAAGILEDAKNRFEMATATNPGLDLSDPAAAAETLVAYYGAEPVAAMAREMAPSIGVRIISARALAFAPGDSPKTMAEEMYQWLPVEDRQSFATSFARLVSAEKPKRIRRRSRP